jgi:hypothetical protein
MLLSKNNRPIHVYNERIGFRTIEFRAKDGLYVNGTKVVLKGINRHSFHPDGGRTTNKKTGIMDGKLIKEMNMNADGYKVFMPAEFQHGMYDQGHGAGLEDFWAQYTAHPLFAGGFMWDFSDNAVRRSDKGGILDSDGSNGTDGILGPYRQKEASYYTVRDVWAPIQFEQVYITPSFKG